MKKKNSFASNGGFFSAFTLAEMMVVMLILSIVLAAMAPVMTTRSKPNNSTPWKYDTSINASARNNIWFGLGSSQHVMIGQDSFLGTDNAKLIINTNGTNSSIGFKNNGTAVGSLWFKNGGMLLGKFAEGGDLGSSAIAIGNEVNAAQEAVAIGKKASAGYINAVAIGANATSGSGIAIGTTANSSSGIAIGSGSKSKRGNAFGGGSEATGQNSIAIGSYAQTNAIAGIVIGSSASIQIDETNKTDYNNDQSAIAIGSRATILPSVENDINKDTRNLRSPAAIAIGKSATAKYDGTIAIGKKAIADGGAIRNRGEIGLSKTEHSSSIAIGREAKAMNAGAISIGDSIVNSGPRAIAIGSKAKIIVDDGEEPRPGYDSNYYVTNGSIAIGAEASAESASYSYDTSSTGSGRALWRVEHAVAIGDKTTAQHGGVAIGGSFVDSGSRRYKGSTTAANGAVAVGECTKAAEGAVAAGRFVEAKGTYSIAIGQYAQTPGDIVTPGDSHHTPHTNRGAIAIGYNASAKGNSVAIGTEAKADKINQIVLGTKDYTVYIPGNLIVGQTSFFGANIQGQNLALGGHFGFSEGVGERGYIGTTKKGNITMYQSGAEYRAKAGYDGAFEFITTHSSDRRLKYVGKENKSGLDKIRQLKVFNYTFKKDTTKTPHVGVIAQDLQKVFPNAVKKGADGFLTIRMEDMFYAVINAIKELDAKYQAQEKRINALEKENKEFKARLDKLEAKVK